MIVVQLTSIDEFIGELQRTAVPESGEAPDAKIMDNMIRWRVNRSPEQREEVSFQVSVWATAILQETDADYLLEFGKALGSSEAKDSPVEIKVNGMESSLKAACDLLGLKVRPGKIEVF